MAPAREVTATAEDSGERAVLEQGPHVSVTGNGLKNATIGSPDKVVLVLCSFFFSIADLPIDRKST